MKILLVTPPQRSKDKLKSEKKFKGIKRGLLPPLGVGYIAAVLEQEGHDVKIIDAPVFDYDCNDIVSVMREFSPDLLGISTMTPVANNAFRLAELVKKEYGPGLPVIIGGAHPTCFPDDTIRASTAIDAVVLGEGEYTVLEIVKRLEQRSDFHDIPNMIYRKPDGGIVKTEVQHQFVDLEHIPFPSRHLYPILKYAPEPYENKRLPSTNVIVSRGCTWAKCTFCHRSGLMRRKYRCQSPEKTIEEIRFLIKTYGIKELVFYDDDLFSNRKWVDKFCDLMAGEKFDVVWSCRGRADTTTYELLKKARKVGLWSIFYGFESGNQDILDTIKKGITLQQCRNVAGWCSSLGIEIVGSFMLALPGEDPVKGLRTIEFAKELDCDYASFIPTHPFIGTELYRQCLQSGKTVGDSYDDKMEKTRFIPKISYVPDGYDSAEQIEELVKKAYRDFYFRMPYILKHLNKIRGLEDIKRYMSGFLFMLGLLRKA